MSGFLNVKSKFIQAINVSSNITYGGYIMYIGTMGSFNLIIILSMLINNEKK